MKKTVLLYFSIFLSPMLIAQQLTPQAISSSGGFVSNNAGMLSYTIGQPVAVSTLSVSGNILTQGFQQVDNPSSGVSNVTADVLNSMTLYPNPATQRVQLKYNFKESGMLLVTVYNTLGQQIKVLPTSPCTANITSTMDIDVATLPAATYYVQLRYTTDKNISTRGDLKFVVIK